ncbi:MAG: type II toxin-antitoxin system VapC family toxin [Acidimicrobiia bacterium]|nr:type II toxin-antitoxin system VapC family toxin [Acidimicrobiia bacterium]
MTLVVDASVLVALLVDSGPSGLWAEEVTAGRALVAPHVVHVETANVLRRAAMVGDVSSDVASLAHADLQDLRVELFSYEVCAERVWELRHNLTAHDAWYVAVAELVDAPLATLDQRLATAPGTLCELLVPPS